MPAEPRRYRVGTFLGVATLGLVFAPSLSNAATLSAAFSTTCATKQDGTAWCWGNNNNLQVINADPRIIQSTPVAQAVVGSVVAVATSWLTSHAVTSAGAAWGWGEDHGQGQLGTAGGLGFAPAPLPDLPTECVDVTESYLHACVVKTDGSTWCWGGFNNNGQDGPQPSADAYATPTEVTGLPSTAIQITAAPGYTCTVMSDGSAWCWGGIGSGGSAPAPMTAFGNNVAQISAGAFGLCTVGLDGTAWCSGAGNATPAQVSSLGNDVRWISVGARHVCAAKTDGTAWCWGENSSGQLGDGTTNSSTTPVRVAGLANVVQLATASAHSCARESDGSVWCWGDNASGQLGDGTTVSRSTAAPVLGFAPPAAPVPATGRRTSAVLAGLLALSAMLALGRSRLSPGRARS